MPLTRVPQQLRTGVRTSGNENIDADVEGQLLPEPQSKAPTPSGLEGVSIADGPTCRVDQKRR